MCINHFVFRLDEIQSVVFPSEVLDQIKLNIDLDEILKAVLRRKIEACAAEDYIYCD